MPKNISEFKEKQIQYIFTDIDDTLSQEGKLPASSYQALWDLHKAGYKIIPVTGRPAGWCEMIVRFWPVEAVIGENGGFYFYFSEEGKLKRHFILDEKEREKNRKKLLNIQAEVLKEVPGTALASDQFTRLMDLAIDFCEDVPALESEQIQKIVSIFRAHGAQAKVSSIHVNGWFGEYNKISMVKELCKNLLGQSFDQLNKQALFIGDSPNDEESFGAFKNSFAVKNIEKFLDQITDQPKYLCNKESSEGFVELSELLLKD